MDWHRLFGLALSDFFSDSPFTVEIEKDLSVKKQFLDVVVIRKETGEFTGTLPDGMGTLADHNLITFKSYQETLDDWALKELIGHYVNYRKQVSASMNDLLPEQAFRLFAVCARFPQKLSALTELQENHKGVYDCNWGTDVIRIIVLHQLPKVKRNAIWHLFSALPELVRYAAIHYQKHSNESSTLIDQLLAHYREEDSSMPYTMEEFRKDYLKEHLPELTAEEILKAVPIEKILTAVPPEKIEELLKKHKPLPKKSEESE